MATERGLFSLQFFSGYEQTRLMNSDGTYSSYSGFSYGGGFDVQLWGAGAGEFRFFGIYEIGSAKGVQVSSDSLTREQGILGVKAFANESIFVAAGIGRTTQKYKNTVSTTTMIHRTTYISVGIEYPLSKNWFLNAAGYYQSGPISMSDNPISANSYFESSGLLLGIVWSPPVTTMIYNTR